MSKLGDEPAYPIGDQSTHPLVTGFSKRERACIDLRIPESGNEELDALIAKAQQRDLTAMAMQGMMANHMMRRTGDDDVPNRYSYSSQSILQANALLAALA